MKPSNPMQQLQQWKDNRNANLHSANTNQSKIGLVKGNKLNIEPVKSAVKNANQTNSGLVKNTQGNAGSETKNKYQGKLSFNPLVFEYTQISRQFKLIHDSNRKCLEVYPDEFHHKVKFRNELADLVVRLKAGSKLLNEMAKSQGVEIKDKYGALKGFNQANNYLIHKFVEVIEQIEQLQVENIEKQKLIVSEGK
jgi:hypothetical protein|nr:MAG TPA: hypothetical protein [Caudoviricetes sp.]